MTPDLKVLWEIQLLDLQRRVLEDRLKDQTVPEELRGLKSSIEDAQSELKETRLEYENLKKETRKFESQDGYIREQIDNIEKKLYGGSYSNIKEMSNTSQKITNLKENLKKTEDRQLVLLEMMERIHHHMEEISQGLNKDKERFRKLHNTYQMNIENVRKTLAQLPLARQRMIDTVDSSLWKRYVQLKARFVDPLGKVEKGTCMGCQMAVPFNDLKRLKQDNVLVYCANCGRILYWERMEKR